MLEDNFDKCLFFRLVEQFNVTLVPMAVKCDAERAFRITSVDVFDDIYHEHMGELIAALGSSDLPTLDEVRVVYVHGPSQSRGEEGTSWPVLFFNYYYFSMTIYLFIFLRATTNNNYRSMKQAGNSTSSCVVWSGGPQRLALMWAN